MEHTPENLEHYSDLQEQKKEEPTPYVERPLFHRIFSWALIVIVVVAFLLFCHEIAVGGRV